jgi:hypothetical protein
VSNHCLRPGGTFTYFSFADGPSCYGMGPGRPIAFQTLVMMMKFANHAKDDETDSPDKDKCRSLRRPCKCWLEITWWGDALTDHYHKGPSYPTKAW